MSENGILLYDPNNSGSKRVCGDCQLCCKLLPVKAMDKKANTRCKQQKPGVGCAVYRSGLPFECKVWTCKWLHGGDTAWLRRPDHSHYVIDIMPDVIRAVTKDGEVDEWTVLQIWVDPDHPDAHRDPALRAYLARVAERDRMPAVVRNGNASAFLLVPASLTEDGEWLEQPIQLSGAEGNRFLERMVQGR